LSVGIVWFRQDLRLSDNPALCAALKECSTIVPVFIDDDRPGTFSQIGAASRVWLHHSLASLKHSLQTLDTDLVVGQGDPTQVLTKIAAVTGAEKVFWNRCYDPATSERDAALKQALATHNPPLEPHSSLGNLLFEPVTTLKANGTPYRVFTPYWKHLMHTLPGKAPLPAPKNIANNALIKLIKRKNNPLHNVSIDALGLLPTRAWGDRIRCASIRSSA